MYILLHLAVLTVTVLALARLLPSVKVKSFGSAIVVAIVFSVLNFFLGWFIRVLLFVPGDPDARAAVPLRALHRQHGPALADRQAARLVRDRDAGRPARLGGDHHGGELAVHSRPRAHPHMVGHVRARPDALDLAPGACNLSRMATTTLRPKTLTYARSRRSPSRSPRPPASAAEAPAARPATSIRRRSSPRSTTRSSPSSDVQERINKQSPFVRARYTSADKKKEFVDGLVRFEVMAAEAARRGYDKDPDVQRVMKQQMISKLMQKDFESKLKVEDVPDADVEKYYNEHPAEFHQKDEVRVSEIVVKDKAQGRPAPTPRRARSPRAAAGAATRRGSGISVTKYSEDEESKPRGGDLSFFAEDSATVPKPIVEAAFKLKEVGDVAPPIKTDKGWAVIRLTQKRPGFNRPLRRGQAPDPAAAVPRPARPRRWTPSSTT